MSGENGLPPYISPGDVAWARRARRSFRFCVTACVLFAGILWLSERYLRYELTESQYIAALTLPTESARAILRSVVKRDAEQRDSPTAEYVAALAEREEEDNILPAYEKACSLDPNNAFLELRYGCRLFQAERYAEARDCFQRASRLPSKNALPKYLEAAAVAFADRSRPPNERGADKNNLTESLALVAKANTGDEPIVFPEPLWSDELPARGVWYAKLRRHIADECCGPLYKYVDLVLSEAKHEINLRNVQYWDSWLATIEIMGQRLIAGTDPGTVQATAGVRIQLDVLAQRDAVARVESPAAGAAFAERRRKLTEALARLNEFESYRDQRIASARAAYTLPLALCGQAMALMFLVFFLTWLVGRILRTDRTTWALPHTRAGLWFLSGSSVALLFLLVVMSVAQHLGVTWHIPVVRLLWRLVIAGVLLFSLVYPRRALRRLSASGTPAETRGCNPLSTESHEEGRGHPERRWMWKAYASYWRRYCGIFTGLLLCVVSVWVVGYRVAFALYPFQVELLVPGFESQETQVVRDAVSLLD